MRFILIYTLIVCNLTSFGQKLKKDLAYSIILASCFQNDTVELHLNGIKLLDTEDVNTDSISGITRIAVYQDKEALCVTYKGKEHIYPPLAIDKFLSIHIILNCNSEKFIVNLKKGKIMFIDNCFVEGQRNNKQQITLKQFRKTVNLY